MDEYRKKRVGLPKCECGYKFKNLEELLEYSSLGDCYCPKCRKHTYSVATVEGKIKRRQKYGSINRYYVI